ncbi:hypothetical protein CPC16_001387 [Podila verticillata]|nr:hypothetical protein CPC16_001387 [Podila verticillata]
MVLRAYVTAVCQEGHTYIEAERIRDAMKGNKHGEWIGDPVFDKAFVNLMQKLKVQPKKSDGTQQSSGGQLFDELLKLKCYHVRIQRSGPEGPLLLSVTVPFRNSSPIDPAKGIKNRETLGGSRRILMEHPFLHTTLSVTRIMANVYRIYPQLESGHNGNFRRQYKNELAKRKQKKVETSEEEEEEDGAKVEVKSEDDEEPLTRRRKSRAVDDTQTSSKKS